MIVWRWRNARDNRGRRVATTWEMWVDALAKGVIVSPQPVTTEEVARVESKLKRLFDSPSKKLERRDLESIVAPYYEWKKRLPAWSPAIFVPVEDENLLAPLRIAAERGGEREKRKLQTALDGGRCLQAVQEVGGYLTCLVIESDGNESIERALELWAGYDCLIYTTTSHTPEAPRFRIVVRISRDMTAEEHAKLLQWAFERHGRGVLAEVEKDASRMWFMPVQGCIVRQIEGKAIDVEEVLAACGGDGAHHEQERGTVVVSPRMRSHSAPRAATLGPKSSIEVSDGGPGAASVPDEVPYAQRLRRSEAYIATVEARGPDGNGGGTATMVAAGKGGYEFAVAEEDCARIMIAHWARANPAGWSEDWLRRKVSQAYANTKGHFRWGGKLNEEPMRPPEVPRVPAPSPEPWIAQFERGDHEELATALLKALEVDGELTHDVGGFWRYVERSGVWECFDDAFVRVSAGRFAGSTYGDGKILRINAGTPKGVESILRDRLRVDPARVKLDAAPPGVAFRNGFLTSSGNLVPHAKENRARWAYPCDYEPYDYRSTPMLNEFFEVLWADLDEAERASRVVLVQEFAGMCLFGLAPSYQRALILMGDGGQGKSAVLDIIKGLFTEETLSTVAPQHWNAKDPFLADLNGKLINVVAELPNETLISGENFKQIITGERVTANRKYKDPVSFTPRAGHIFATNAEKIPTSDHSRGFYRRALVLRLTRYLDVALERVKDIGQRIVEAEGAFLPAWAVEGALRLQRRGDFYISEQMASDTMQMQIESDPALRFLLSAAPLEERVECEAFYKAYRAWCATNGYKPVSSGTFRHRVTGSRLYERGRTGYERFYVRRSPSTIQH